jgi:hypothetical protein
VTTPVVSISIHYASRSITSNAMRGDEVSLSSRPDFWDGKVRYATSLFVKFSFEIEQARTSIVEVHGCDTGALNTIRDQQSVHDSSASQVLGCFN